MTSAQTASTAVIDLHMPETFHNLKRTVLLFSSILFVLSFVHGAGDQALNITFLSIKLPIDVIRSMLWGAALYYLIGFLMEVRIVRLLNSETMLGEGMKTVDKAMGKLGARISNLERDMSGAVDSAKHRVSALTDLTIVTVDPTSLSQRVVDLELALEVQHPLRRDKAGELRTSQLMDAFTQQNTSAQVALSHLGTMADAMVTFTSRGDQLQTLLEETRKDIGRISRRVSGDRRLSFWIWEVGGAVGGFAAATLINWPWMVRSLAFLWRHSVGLLF